MLVCAGVLKLQNDQTAPRGKFKTPYLNAKYISGSIFLVASILLWNYNKDNVKEFISAKKIKPTIEVITQLSSQQIIELQQKAIAQYDAKIIVTANTDSASINLESLKPEQTKSLLRTLSIEPTKLYSSGWNIFKHNIPMWIFIVISLLLVYWSFTKNLSLIPVLGLVSCLYMMAEIELENWIGFAIWLVVGLIIYFSFSYKNSKLNTQKVYPQL